MHLKKSNFVCHFCDRAFYTANSVKAHLKKHIRKRPVLTSGGPEPYDESESEEEKEESKVCLENGHDTKNNPVEQTLPNGGNDRYVLVLQ